MTRTQNDFEILAPKPVDVTVGDRKFVQEPLSLRATTGLIVAVSEEFERATSSPAVMEFMDSDMEKVPALSFVPKLLKALSDIPNAVPRILSIILTGDDTDADLVAFIDKQCRPVQALRILRTFVEQNEPEELIENFTALRSMLGNAMNKAKEKATT